MQAITKNEFAAGEARDDADLVRRIQAAYRCAYEAFASPPLFGESQWSAINAAKVAAHRALLDKESKTAQALLRDPCRGNFFYGFDDLFAERTLSLRANPQLQQQEAAVFTQAIHKLAQFVGAVRVPNPEAPDRYRSEENIESLLSRIEVETELAVIFPNPFSDEFGLATSRGIVSIRPIYALYQAHKIQEQLRTVKGRSVIEIGGGLGRTAFYARKMVDAPSYTIIDLPLASAAQAYFLGRTLGDESISLFGEPMRNATVAILPPNAIERSPVGLVINVDSLTEMDRQSAEHYVGFARDHAGRFISINHETNSFTAREVVQSVWPGCNTMRYPHPIRDGYVEEIITHRKQRSSS
jgi:hypothetical protein